MKASDGMAQPHGKRSQENGRKKQAADDDRNNRSPPSGEELVIVRGKNQRGRRAGPT
jgi:hypothetical protein